MLQQQLLLLLPGVALGAPCLCCEQCLHRSNVCLHAAAMATTQPVLLLPEAGAGSSSTGQRATQCGCPAHLVQHSLQQLSTGVLIQLQHVAELRYLQECQSIECGNRTRFVQSLLHHSMLACAAYVAECTCPHQTWGGSLPCWRPTPRQPL